MPNASDFTAQSKSLPSSSAMSSANQSKVVQSFDFGFGAGARRGNSADRSGDLSTDVVTPSLKRTDDLRSDPSREARELFNLGLVHALEYGIASADLKPSIPWARSRFLERKRLR